MNSPLRRFVRARIWGIPKTSIEGVCISKNKKTIIVMTEAKDQFLCEPTAIVIPDNYLTKSEKRLVNEIRKQL